jgi:ADP-heptose:LPS heptosyltransferase
MPKPKHILVIRFSAMGDVAMTVPVLRALSEQHSNVKITVLTIAFFKSFFVDVHNVDVICADLKGKYKGVLGLYKLSKDLRALRFDAVADVHNVLRSKILKFFFFGIKVVQLDKGRLEKKALVTGKLFQQLKTMHQRYADVFESLGYSIDLSQPHFPKSKSLTEQLSGFITKKEFKTIGIAPFAAHQSKMYPLTQMEDVISMLSKDYNVILFGGGAKEINILNQFETKYSNVTSVAGKLNLEDEIVLISNLDLMLSMDSGNGHIAAMLGKKVITIWGVTHPFAGFSPFNQPKDYALTADRDEFPLIPTSVYGNKYPKGYENAAGSIAVGDVISKVQSVLQSEAKNL